VRREFVGKYHVLSLGIGSKESYFVSKDYYAVLAFSALSEHALNIVAVIDGLHGSECPPGVFCV
jgi:hypothetical protein